MTENCFTPSVENRHLETYKIEGLAYTQILHQLLIDAY